MVVNEKIYLLQLGLVNLKEIEGKLQITSTIVLVVNEQDQKDIIDLDKISIIQIIVEIIF